MGSEKILLVEDEPNLAFSLKLNLESEGYTVIHAAKGTEALMMFGMHRPFAAIVLDVMLPELNGFEIAERIRKSDERVGIIMLTARASNQDRIQGLEAGVDDYLTKPFHFQELLLRIKRMVDRDQLLRVGNGNSEIQPEARNNGELVVGPLRLNPETLELTSPTGRHIITALEADLLKEFMLQPGRVLSRTHLLDRVWKMQGEVETRTVDNFVMRLRRYIEANPSEPQLLKSIRGRGYQLTIDS